MEANAGLQAYMQVQLNTAEIEIPIYPIYLYREYENGLLWVKDKTKRSSQLQQHEQFI